MRRLVGSFLGLAVSGLIFIAVLEVLIRLFVPVRNVGEVFSEFDPVLGKHLKRNLVAVRKTPEFTMTLTTNSMGFRGPEPSQTSTIALLFVGDSFTMGYGVNDGEEFPFLVGERLRAATGLEIDVYNAGVGATGNGRWLGVLDRHLTSLEPALVVLAPMVNDFDDNQVERLYAYEDGRLVKQPVVPSRARRLQGFLEAVPFLVDSYIFGLAQQLVIGGEPIGSPPEDADLGTVRDGDQITFDLLEASFEKVEDAGIPGIVLLIEIAGERGQRITELARRHGLPTIGSPPKAQRGDLYYVVDGHWNAAGHAHVAEMLTDYILTRRREMGI